MTAFGHVAYDWNVVGLVGQNEPSKFRLAHDTAQRFRISRVTACDPMWSQLEDIADLRDRACQQIRFQRALLKPVSVAQNNLVDLIEGEARDLNRSAG